MAEYIEREAVLKVLRGSAIGKYPASFYMGLFAAADEVARIHAADVVPVVHGRWITKNGRIVCDQCEAVMAVCPNRDYLNAIFEELKTVEKFCFHCGARMGGE